MRAGDLGPTCGLSRRPNAEDRDRGPPPQKWHGQCGHTGRGRRYRSPATGEWRHYRQIEQSGWSGRASLDMMRRGLNLQVFAMIVKAYRHSAPHRDPRLRAGAEAERQMAHYLHRSFNEDPELHVLHNLRIEDPDRLDQDGSPRVCQIDHLIVHRWGMFIIESKSVREAVQVRPDGSGGDEWSRVYQSKETGMPSPIQQARRQSEVLRAFLQRRREELVGRMPFGVRTLAKATVGSDQRGFRNAPIQLVIAVSDGGRIDRLDGWKEPRKPFRVFVAKADLVPDKIRRELKRHRAGSSLLKVKPTGDYGLWSMEAGEAGTVAEFLVAQHAERPGPSTIRSNRAPVVCPPDRSSPIRARTASSVNAVCKHCGGRDLAARSGRYGYYWRCGACGKNTTMPKACPACAAVRQSDNQAVRIRKEGTTYFRACNACGTSTVIWIEA